MPGENGGAALTATLDTALDPARDLLWCATFQLCWDELRGWLEGDVRVEPPVSLATALNRDRVAKDQLPGDATVSAAGPVAEGLLDRLAAQAAERFGPDADLPILARLRGQSYGPDDIVAYAALLRRLAFPVPFESRDRFDFAGATVAGFGVGGPRRAELRAQLRLHRYRGPADFVLAIDTDREDERILVARGETAATLGETVGDVVAAAAGEGEPLQTTDDFGMPCVAIDAETSYSELTGRDLIGPQRRYRIAEAVQNLRLGLDETGARVRSEAAMVAFGLAFRREPEPRRLVCDGPFLLLLHRRGAARPYVAAWIATPALLAR